MRVVLSGSGGPRGWPEPGCGCASCAGAAATGSRRAPWQVVVDGALTLAGGGPPAGPPTGVDVTATPLEGVDVTATPSRGGPGGGSRGYRVREIPGGWDVTAPDGGRLLCADGSGLVLRPDEGSRPYDVALVDVLGDPAQLGLLRARGLVTEQTAVAVACADHRVGSERELETVCGFWGVAVVPDAGEVNVPRSFKRFKRVLITGGARSGKSGRAEARLAAEPAVSYIAAAPAAHPGDAEWAHRVAMHRASRPGWWRTIETTDLVPVLGGAAGPVVLIDGIGTWLAAVLDECGAWSGAADALPRVATRVAELVQAWRQATVRVVAVTDETGFGVVPAHASGRLFRDELGRLNQRLAAESEVTELMIAGRAIPLPLW